MGADLGRPLRVLAIGAHCDDIEIGAGGTLLEWADAGVPMAVDWFVLTSTPEREREVRASAESFLQGAVSVGLTIQAFRDGFLPYEGRLVKEAFEALQLQVDPDVILTHSRDDLHQDHRVVGHLTWNTFRRHLILEYEVPKYDGDLGQPNAFVEVSEANIRRKWAYLEQAYQSQADHQWFSASTFEGLMRLRGVEMNSPSGYAEAFTARKVALAVTPVNAAPTRRERASLTLVGGRGGPVARATKDGEQPE